MELEGEENPEDFDDEEVQRPLGERIIDYIVNSSLFIFNRHAKIRQFCLMLAESEAVLEELKKKEAEGDENYINDGESINSFPATVVES